MDLRRAAAVAVAAVVTTACQASVAVWKEGAVAARPEPVSAAHFVAAFGAGDETAAERAASPFYAAEWARRGLSTSDRASVRVLDAPNQRPTPLAFQYVNGAVEPDGVEH